ncbi:protein phosphatase 2C domain-containing protein [Longimicrobium sp.]|uniref:protein phosphatase 2C domain-containing protein n=1 Tax=Longimicrobium sp. TaxID=2029185 RepID=UPI002C7FED54|nr:protein phosphatase 2C domain-containing protein [Longimicrobium sp.]HSU17515.1 protein phosphatase 2C domain-containing protein [Longimicrobium sp.]
MQRPTIELVSRPAAREVQYEAGTAELPDGRALALALGYRRAHEFDRGDHPGQDFAALRAAGRRVVGVVADGVSQSFFGEIAARAVATGLLDFLWSRAGTPPGPRETVAELERLAAGALAEVEAVHIPEHLPEMQRTALARQRADAGSQTVFAALVYDAETGRARLYQVGDAGVVLFGTGEAGTPVAPEHPRARWSTHSAEALRLEVRDYRGVQGAVLRSDGAREFGDLRGDPSAADAFRARAEELAGYDDVSFVAVQADGAPADGPLSLVGASCESAPPRPQREAEGAAPVPAGPPGEAGVARGKPRTDAARGAPSIPPPISTPRSVPAPRAGAPPVIEVTRRTARRAGPPLVGGAAALATVAVLVAGYTLVNPLLHPRPHRALEPRFTAPLVDRPPFRGLGPAWRLVPMLPSADSNAIAKQRKASVDSAARPPAPMVAPAPEAGAQNDPGGLLGQVGQPQPLPGQPSAGPAGPGTPGVGGTPRTGGNGPAGQHLPRETASGGSPAPIRPVMPGENPRAGGGSRENAAGPVQRPVGTVPSPAPPATPPPGVPTGRGDSTARAKPAKRHPPNATMPDTPAARRGPPAAAA